MESVDNVKGDSGGNATITSGIGATNAPPGTDSSERQAPDMVATPPKSDESTVSHSTDITTLPTQPTIVPIVPYTPKRQIKLATSNSSAAAWFATGAISSAKKKDPDPKDTPPATIEFSPQEVTLPTMSSFTEELVIAEQDTVPVVFNLTESSHTAVHPVVLKEPEPDGFVGKGDMNMTGMPPCSEMNC